MENLDDIPANIEKGTQMIDGMNIFYCRSGKGSHVLLLLPGSIGVAWDDYKYQLLDLDHEVFTLVLIHPPGLGKSRPPDRTLPDNYLQRDAKVAYTIMKNLGYKKYSLLGWLNGGTISLILGAMYPEVIDKIVVSNCKSRLTKNDIEAYTAMKDIDTWSATRRDSLIAIYGREYLKYVWTTFVNKMIEIYETKGGNLCEDILPKVQASVLVLHGNNEKLSDKSHAKYTKDRIKNARLFIFENGEHNMHVTYHESFNNIVSEFLLQS